MYFEVIEVHVTGPMQLAIKFADGLQGVVTFQPSFLYGVFEALKAPETFSRVSCKNGFLEWPEEVDLAPDAMYRAIKETGACVLQ